MPLFITPGELTSRASLYQQLSQLTAAGITLQSAVEMQHRSPPGRSLRQALAAVLEQLQMGSTFAQALTSAERWVPAFDIALLHAGEQSGRLPASFSLLANYYESNARLLRQLISGLLYPALLFHMAILLGPLPYLFRTWNFVGYAAQVLAILLPTYAVVLAVAWLINGYRHEQGAAMVEAFFHRIPLLGKARRNLALARLSSALEALISAGVPILQAWELAASACGSPAIRRAVARWQPGFASGVTPAEAIRQSTEFPDVFANLYQTGEITGTLDDTLRRLQAYHHDEGARQMKALADWTPKIVYLGVAILVAWQVIQAWTNYFDSMNKLIAP